MMELAFYRGTGRLYDRLIRWWTGSEYSHIEICWLRDEASFHGISASARDGGVRAKTIMITPGHWDFYPADGDLSRIRHLSGKKYDWLGIVFSQVLPFGWGHPDRYFCSELVAMYLGLDRPHKYSPQGILEAVSGKTDAIRLDAI